jgi:hypothetical protein
MPIFKGIMSADPLERRCANGPADAAMSADPRVPIRFGGNLPPPAIYSESFANRMASTAWFKESRPLASVIFRR